MAPTTVGTHASAAAAGIPSLGDMPHEGRVHRDSARLSGISYLGPEGTFTEIAARSISESAGARLLPKPSAAQALDAVRRQEADAAVVPLDNTVSGPVPGTVDALAAGEPLTIRQEVRLSVVFSLLVRAGTSAEDIRTVAGHPHARPQVRRWLADRLPWARWVPAASNAAGAQQVSEGRYDAAVAPHTAALTYALTGLAHGIQDHEGASTRFVLVSGSPGRPQSAAVHRTTLLGRVAGDPDAVRARIEEVFGGAGRRPLLPHRTHVTAAGPEGSVTVLIDCAGHAAQPLVRTVTEELLARLPELRSLGSHPASDTARTAGSAAALIV
ncbi:prephenate dehydratase domain-containing protein [Streptomyces pinistramenti]|uniref:prephenate dehydratase domain-containing protein n=1 Tax=Streptomyces pinistramenti TaxID=2884812 RepID=UPI001D0655B7|nr:prephenate dehydratase domain-containing protein [Streptomyces pinistramenti]MCB5908046.1 prephenate dehydratase [Streptomyces pinistramenti]